MAQRCQTSGLQTEQFVLGHGKHLGVLFQQFSRFECLAVLLASNFRVQTRFVNAHSCDASGRTVLCQLCAQFQVVVGSLAIAQISVDADEVIDYFELERCEIQTVGLCIYSRQQLGRFV